MKRKILITLACMVVSIVSASCNQQPIPTTEVSHLHVESTNTKENTLSKNIQSVNVDVTGLTINKDYIINLIDNLSIESDTIIDIETYVEDSFLEVYINSNYFMSIKFFNNCDITKNSIFKCNNIDYSLSDMENYFLSEIGGYSAYLIDMYSYDDYKNLLNYESDKLDWIVTLRNEILIDGQNLITHK